jgi:hypothetical protein
LPFCEQNAQNFNIISAVYGTILINNSKGSNTDGAAGEMFHALRGGITAACCVLPEKTKTWGK